MKTLIIKSNHGNHSGYNRKWTILEEFEDWNDFNSPLTKLASIYNDIKDLDEDNEEYEYSLSSFEDDLCYYYVVTEEDYHNGFFNGGHYGYASDEIIEFFENKT